MVESGVSLQTSRLVVKQQWPESLYFQETESLETYAIVPDDSTFEGADEPFPSASPVLQSQSDEPPALRVSPEPVSPSRASKGITGPGLRARNDALGITSKSSRSRKRLHEAVTGEKYVPVRRVMNSAEPIVSRGAGARQGLVGKKSGRLRKRVGGHEDEDEDEDVSCESGNEMEVEEVVEVSKKENVEPVSSKRSRTKGPKSYADLSALEADELQDAEQD
ncbi:hypothetical protein LTR17_011617 [Elasticomyces elasticus]|nr:hypothetical protein LTR17_011617 [Elasticomyces elasticus]